MIPAVLVPWLIVYAIGVISMSITVAESTSRWRNAAIALAIFWPVPVLISALVCYVNYFKALAVWLGMTLEPDVLAAPNWGVDSADHGVYEDGGEMALLDEDDEDDF